MSQVPLIPGVLPSNCYPATPQELYVQMFELGAADVGDLEGVIISAAEPDPEDRDKLWIQVDGSGNPVSQWIFGGGTWRWPHPLQSRDYIVLWRGDLTSLNSLDGGAAGPVTATSGPFWEVVADFAGRIPMGVGAIPGSDPAESIALAEDKGAASHTMTQAELVPHEHAPGSNAENGSFWGFKAGAGGPYGSTGGSDTILFPTTTETGDGDPFSVLNPVRGIYFIARTARIFKTP